MKSSLVFAVVMAVMGVYSASVAHLTIPRGSVTDSADSDGSTDTGSSTTPGDTKKKPSTSSGSKTPDGSTTSGDSTKKKKPSSHSGSTNSSDTSPGGHKSPSHKGGSSKKPSTNGDSNGGPDGLNGATDGSTTPGGSSNKPTHGGSSQHKSSHGASSSKNKNSKGPVFTVDGFTATCVSGGSCTYKFTVAQVKPAEKTGVVCSKTVKGSSGAGGSLPPVTSAICKKSHRTWSLTKASGGGLKLKVKQVHGKHNLSGEYLIPQSEFSGTSYKGPKTFKLTAGG